MTQSAASATATPPSAAACELLNGRDDRRFGEPAIVVSVARAREPRGQPIRPEGGCRIVRDERQEPVVGESAEATSHYALGCTDYPGGAASRGSQDER